MRPSPDARSVFLPLAVTLLFGGALRAQTDLITNGQFTSGLAGWTAAASATSVAGTCSYNAVAAPGVETVTSTPGFPASGPATTSIALGSVSLSATGFRSCVLYQDVAIPAGATTATIAVESGTKVINALPTGDTAIFIGLYPTSSVPDFQSTTFLGGNRLIVPGFNGTVLVARGPVTLNVAAVAGTTVRFAIINAIQSTGSGSGPPTPGGAAVIGLGNVRLTASVPAPTVTGLSPTLGPSSGGTSVTITGTNFTGATAVNFGATPATSFTVVSATRIDATAPAGTAGPVNVRVTTGGGTSATAAANLFTYVAAPTVTGISPATGPVAGGTSVTISGTNFTGATAVQFGSTPAASFTVVNAVTITATAPAGSAGAVNATVTTPGGTSAISAANLFAYVALPTVTGLSPTSGPTTAGTPVSIIGTNLTGATAVLFGATPATSFTVVSATRIDATAPAGTAGPVNVRVTTGGGTSATAAANLFTYVAAPTVTSISPAAGPIAGGTAVTITGTNLTGATAVNFGATAAASFTVVNATTITATAPAGSAGAVNTTVTTPGGTSAAGASNLFTYAGLPTITSLSPATGPIAGGTSVTVTGTNLTGATAVNFGATPAASFTVVNATTVTAVAPARSAGVINVTITTPGGTSVASPASQFTYADVPTITSLSPATGPIAGGTSVTVTGTNLTGATAVNFGAAAATSFTVVNATTITAVAPAGTAGVVSVAVTTPAGTSTAGPGSQFTYLGVPTVSSLSPATGPIAGGTSVTITGTNLSGATAVAFGATLATSFTVVNATTITTVAPAGSPGAVSVAITTPAGTSTSSSGSQFTYASVPTITGLTPSAGSITGGTSVTITGTNFTGATAVRFGTTPATSFTVASNTTITAVAPAGTAGTVTISVLSPAGTSPTGPSAQFAYTTLPIISSLSPATGPVTGGTSVTITGTSLTGATAVNFGATPATSFSVLNATTIMAVTPAGTRGTVNVAVTTPSGTSSASAGSQFAYGAPPPIDTPTLGEWAMIALAMLLAGAGYLAMRRHAA